MALIRMTFVLSILKFVKVAAPEAALTEPFCIDEETELEQAVSEWPSSVTPWPAPLAVVTILLLASSMFMIG